MMRTLLLSSLALTSLASAAEPVALTPFELAAGSIPLPAGLSLPTGPQRVKLVWMNTEGGGVETDDACRVGLDGGHITQLPGRQCPKLWRSTNPRTVVVSVDGTALPLKWAVLDTRSLLGPELQLPEGPSAWAGYDRYTSGWVTWTGPVPPGVAAAARSGESTMLYGKRDGGVESWKVSNGSMPTAIFVPTPAPQAAPPPPQVAAPQPPQVAPPPAAPPVRPPDAEPTPIPVVPRPQRAPRTAPPARSPAASGRTGALRLGAVAIVGGAVNQRFAARIAPESGQAELVLTSDAPADLDLFIGYAPFPSTRDEGPCSPKSRCVAPLIGLGIPTQGAASLRVASLHLGAEYEWTRGFSTGLVATARQVSRLADGAQLAQPVSGGSLPVVDRIGVGAGLSFTATPRWGER